MLPAIMLFAKAPAPGRVKTRLAPLVGAARAAELHEAFVRDMLERLSSLRGPADLFLYTDEVTDAWGDLQVATKLQRGGDLGLKMIHALEEALAAGRPRAMIVGSDAPTLPRAHLLRLLEPEADAAFGPCEDGGYYAIACRRVHAAMFDGVTWSGASTLVESERAARACGLTTARGPLWYDVDDPAALRRLAAQPALPPHTAAALARAGLR